MGYPISAYYESGGHGVDELGPRRMRGEDSGVDMRMAEMFRQSFMRGKKSGKGRSAPKAKEWNQRCAVQVRYTKGGSVGKWFSHGSYIARESAVKVDGQGVGFDGVRSDIPVAETVAQWRKDKDGLFFRIIISPEQGERLDLADLTRDVMRRMQEDLATSLEWVAVEHHNTDNPHVHVVVRGNRDDGMDLRIPELYVQQGLRNRAEQEATNRLGYRTSDDIVAVQRKEVGQSRFTGLDRKIKQRQAEAEDGLVWVDHKSPSLEDIGQATEFHMMCRLRKLKSMGLASEEKDGRWKIDPEWEKSLRTAQKAVDRIKMMEAHGEMASGTDMPFRLLRAKEMESVEGKILVHGQDEHSGNNFALVETIQGELVRIPHVKEIAGARKFGSLAPGNYMRLQRADDGFQVEDFGDAALLVSDRKFLAEHGQRLREQVTSAYGGWLGQLRASVAPVKEDRKPGYSR